MLKPSSVGTTICGAEFSMTLRVERKKCDLALSGTFYGKHKTTRLIRRAAKYPIGRGGFRQLLPGLLEYFLPLGKVKRLIARQRHRQGERRFAGHADFAANDIFHVRGDDGVRGGGCLPEERIAVIKSTWSL